MVNRNAPSPSDLPVLGMESVFEAQARMWNQFLDAQRSLWTLYAPWLQTAPWWNGGLARPAEAYDAAVESATTADGIPDVLESQTRAWNHLIDANRRFWTPFSWPLPAVLGDAPAGLGEAANEAPVETAPARRPPSAKKPRRSR